MLRYSCIFLFLIYFWVLCASQLSKPSVGYFHCCKSTCCEMFSGNNPGFRIWGMRKLFFLHHHFHFNWPQSSWTQEFPDRTENRRCCHVTLKHGGGSLQNLDEGFAERISFSVTWAHGQTGCCFHYCVKTQSKHSFTLEWQHKLWTRSTENA